MLKNLKTHKDNAHKLQTDLADAEKARAELFRNLETLEEAVQQRASELGSQRARLEQLSQVTSAIQVLKAKRDTTVAETAKRKAALVREVQNTSMEQLQAMQACRPIARRTRSLLKPCTARRKTLRARKSSCSTRRRTWSAACPTRASPSRTCAMCTHERLRSRCGRLAARSAARA